MAEPARFRAEPALHLLHNRGAVRLCFFFSKFFFFLLIFFPSSLFFLSNEIKRMRRPHVVFLLDKFQFSAMAPPWPSSPPHHTTHNNIQQQQQQKQHQLTLFASIPRAPDLDLSISRSLDLSSSFVPFFFLSIFLSID
ncbi:hypothetical protein Sjap_007074 [Stephania japonica]|uniref:Uncharacterized protein n=1 Tax=Stephania japonica TaxID=461633 RepID=A0AAP0K745_9MAGN